MQRHSNATQPQFVQIDLANIERDDSLEFHRERIEGVSSAAKLIFLDVDGVLNTSEQHLATSISSQCLRLMCELCIRTSSYIVISSTWRKHKPFMTKLLSCLRQYDCEERVLGKTCEIAPFERPAEIMKWMKDAKRQFGLEVSGWVALDDMPLEQMSADMANHCVLTTIQRGFERHHISMGERILNAGGARNGPTPKRASKKIARTVTPTDSVETAM
ncbi:hypothetical protein TrST_g4135 [Triparma strigata]|uniref:Uncharacterized protein n=1 Tax=Triparma strigata TaxID=1606541 RepID=A0A9W6ZTA8_9STRA|nr:hypothetical protein TrST_g4135 [Triparma strigata]